MLTKLIGPTKTRQTSSPVQNCESGEDEVLASGDAEAETENHEENYEVYDDDSGSDSESSSESSSDWEYIYGY
jgi:hypothetical protein